MLNDVVLPRYKLITLALFAGLGVCVVSQGIQIRPVAKVVVGQDSLELDQGAGYVSEVLNAKPGESSVWVCPIDKNELLHATVILVGDGAFFNFAGEAGEPFTVIKKSDGVLGQHTTLTELAIQSSTAQYLVIKATAGPTSSARLTATLRFSAKTRLISDINPPVVAKPKGCAFIRAKLEDASMSRVLKPSGEWLCAITDPEARKEWLTLHDDGLHEDGEPNDGTFGIALCGESTRISGDYEVHIRAQGEREGVPLRRDVITSFTVLSDGAGFMRDPEASTRDADGNKLIDTLDYHFDLLIKDPGEYRLVSTVRDRNGRAITHLTTKGNANKPAPMRLTVSIPSERIVRNGVPGPWTLTDISLWKEGVAVALVATAKAIRIDQYELTSLEPPPPPIIVDIAPIQGPIAGGNQVIISGTGLGGATQVRFGGESAHFEIRNELSIAAIVPRLKKSIVQRVAITVVTPWGSVTSRDIYTFE